MELNDNFKFVGLFGKGLGVIKKALEVFWVDESPKAT